MGVGEGQHRSGSGVRAAQKREWGEGSTEVGVEWGEGQHRSWSGVKGSTEVGVG